MAGNIFGHTLTLTGFGESHGCAVGGILDGMPAGISLDVGAVQSELERRRAKSETAGSTTRFEDDKIEILSGLYKGLTTGTPLAFVIKNKEQRSEDYKALEDVYRPSHGDFTYRMKYGVRDPRGGGRASARETAVRVAAGAIAKQIIPRMSFSSSIVSVGGETDITKFEALILESQRQGDSLGGVIECRIKNVPVGLGEPVFDKLEAQLAKAMLSIPACKGFELGSGFQGAKMHGSEQNDIFLSLSETATNNSGGIQAGISNGQEIYFRLAFKPVATIMRDQQSINSMGEKVVIKPSGRHDVSVLQRALVVVEAMAALVMADFYLRNKTLT